MLFASRLVELNGASVLVYFSAWFLSFFSIFSLMPALEHFQWLYLSSPSPLAHVAMGTNTKCPFRSTIKMNSPNKKGKAWAIALCKLLSVQVNYLSHSLLSFRSTGGGGGWRQPLIGSKAQLLNLFSGPVAPGCGQGRISQEHGLCLLLLFFSLLISSVGRNVFWSGNVDCWSILHICSEIQIWASHA